MSTNQRHTMSLFASQLLSIFLTAIILLGIANAQIFREPDLLNNHIINKYQRSSRGYKEPVITLNPDILERARRTISHLSPEARRFLFSPTIQNTITNLNHNTNTQEIQAPLSNGNEGAADRSSPEIIGQVNSNSGTIEYDLRGRAKKICFIIG